MNGDGCDYFLHVFFYYCCSTKVGFPPLASRSFTYRQKKSNIHGKKSQELVSDGLDLNLGPPGVCNLVSKLGSHIVTFSHWARSSEDEMAGGLRKHFANCKVLRKCSLPLICVNFLHLLLHDVSILKRDGWNIQRRTLILDFLHCSATLLPEILFCSLGHGGAD